MEIIPDKRKLIGVVEQGGHGKLCLPNFQRDFVWTRDEIADLLRSILRGYFVGSLSYCAATPTVLRSRRWRYGAQPLRSSTFARNGSCWMVSSG